MINKKSWAVLGLTFLAAPAFAQNLKSADYVELNEKSLQSTEVSASDASLLKLQTFNFTEPLDPAVRVLKSTMLNLLDWTTKHNENNMGEPYMRITHFGAWINDPSDDTCYNTRGKVLQRDSRVPVQASLENHCKVKTGEWLDPYTQATIKDASEIQIDHVVPLKNAYVSGAYRWPRAARCHYANYIGNSYHLLSVSGTQNMSKGDRSPARYLPPTLAYRCQYIKTWLKIKIIWGLNMSLDEAAGIQNEILTHHCDESQFAMSPSELSKQRRIIAATDYSCRL